MAGVIVSRRLDLLKISVRPLGLALALTAATIIFGETVNGARLWLRIGPVQFQPSEIARLLLAGFVAVYLYDHRHLVIDALETRLVRPATGAVLVTPWWCRSRRGYRAGVPK